MQAHSPLEKNGCCQKKGKAGSLGFNVKTVYVGGLRNTPIDLPASVAAGETRYIDSETFKNKNPDYFRLDIRISLKRNYKNLTSTLTLDIQNVTNRKNVGGQYFDAKTGKINYYYQSQIIPLLSYRLEF
jgi:hypothetical protein